MAHSRGGFVFVQLVENDEITTNSAKGGRPHEGMESFGGRSAAV